jgi:SAM-dependent methyltransferase
VTGLDVNPGMLAVARSVSETTQAPIEWRHASADATGLPDGAYDAVVCQCGLQFFPDPAAALRELHRVLASRWTVRELDAGADPPLFAILEEALRDHVAVEVASFVQVVFRLHDRELLRDLLGDAGFVDAAVHRPEYGLRLVADRVPLALRVEHAARAAVAELDDAQRAAFERDVVTEWSRFTRGAGLLLEVDVVYAMGRVRGNA